MLIRISKHLFGVVHRQHYDKIKISHSILYGNKSVQGSANFRLSMGSPKRELMLFSSSRVYGSSYLEFAANDLTSFLKDKNVSTLLFVPYAIRDHEGYTQKITEIFGQWDFKINSIHNASDPVKAVEEAEAVFIGGGNTFVLLKALYEKGLIEPIRKRVLQDGVPYIGCSAGTNVATVNICTTNDMPIEYPPTFDALGLVPFNINPHYHDPEPDSKHMGETQKERILQYQELPGKPAVVSLREGTFLLVKGNTMTLKGLYSAVIFEGGKAKEVEMGTDLSYLLNI